MRRYMYILGALAAAVLVAWAVWFSFASSGQERPMTGIVTAPGTAALEVRDQLGVLDALKVDRVLAPGDSWVVVYLQGMGGMTGRRVGLVRVRAGETRDLLVPFEKGVRLTDDVIVVLQADMGVPSAFEFDAGRFAESPDKPYFVGGVELAKTVLVRFSEMGNAV
jgi:hypothetical protein